MNMKITLWAILLGGIFAAFGGETNEVKPPCCRELPVDVTFSDKSIYQLESLWTSDVGRKIKLGVLHGKPQVVAMFFASCQFACPLIVGDMKKIAAALPENMRTNVGFVLISFDSEHDTVKALHSYRQTHQLSATNWTLLRGEPEDVRELAALLGVNYRQDASGQFSHSNLITLLNGEGESAYQQAGLNKPVGEMVKKLDALAKKPIVKTR